MRIPALDPSPLAELEQRRRPWLPMLPSPSPGAFGMVDLLTFAGVDPATRGQ